MRIDVLRDAVESAARTASDPDRTDMERRHARELALGWLRERVALAEKGAEAAYRGNLTEPCWLLAEMRHDRLLAPFREEETLAKLPEEEQEAWRKFWGDLDETWKRIR
jgi:hypothetical protein